MNEQRSWLGLNRPELELYEAHVGIVGAPYDGSVSHERGAAQAPVLLREIASDTRPQTEEWKALDALRLKDCGDVAVDDADPEATQRSITRAVRTVVEAGAIPLVLGGDHSVTAGAVAALSDRPDLGILWFDSHPDLMDHYRGLRGQWDSPWNHACPLRRIMELPNVNPENVLLVGIREYIPEELAYMRELGIEMLSARALLDVPADALARRIAGKFAHVPDVYLSIDIDVLDPACAPGTGTLVPGGISTRYLYNALYHLVDLERQSRAKGRPDALRVAGFDLVEIAPRLDVGRITSLAGMGILVAMFGYLAVQLGLPEPNLY